MRALWLVLIFLFHGIHAFAEEEPREADDVRAAADRVQASVAAANEETLRSLAERDTPDPWLVADELLARGAREAARSFAAAAPRPDTEKLVGYVAEWKSASEDPARLEDLRAIRQRLARSVAERDLGRHASAATGFRSAAEAARRIGWLAGASRALAHAKLAAGLARDLQAAREAAEMRLEVEQERKSRWGETAALFELGMVALGFEEEDRARAYFDRAVELCRSAGDARGAAQIHRNLGRVFVNMGRKEPALKAYVKAAAAFKEAGADLDRSRVLCTMGVIHGQLGRVERSVELLEESVALARTAGDRKVLGLNLLNLGIVRFRRHEYAEALPNLEEAREHRASIGDLWGTALALDHLAQVHLAEGRLEKARESATRALELRTRGGKPEEISAAHQTLARVAVRTGKQEDVRARLLTARETLDAVADTFRKSRALIALGNVASELQQIRLAVEFYGSALDIAEAAHDAGTVVGARANRAMAYKKLGRHVDSLADYRVAERLYRQLEMDGPRAQVLNAIGCGLVHLGRLDEAIPVFEEAGTVGQSAVSWDAVAESQGQLSIVLRIRRRPEDADAAWARAEEARERIQDRRTKAVGLSNLAAVANFLGAWELGRNAAQRSLDAHETIRNWEGMSVALQNLSGACLRLGLIDEGIAAASRSNELGREFGLPLHVIGSLQYLSQGLSEIGESGKAIEYAEQALDLARASGQVALVGQALNTLGVLHRFRGELDQALVFYEQAIQQKREIGDRVGLSAALANLSLLHLNRGDIGRSRLSLEKAIRLSEKTGDRLLLAQHLLQLGELVAKSGSADEARALLARAREIADGERDPAFLRLVVVAQASVHQDLGEYTSAIRDQETARDLARDLGLRLEEFGAVLELGRIHAWLGRRPRATELFSEALELAGHIRPTGPQSAHQARAALAEVMEQEGFDVDAREAYERAAASLREDPRLDRTPAYLAFYAGTLRKLGRYEQAAEILERVRVEHERRGVPGGVIDDLEDLSAVYAELGENERAEASITEGLARARSSGNHRQEESCLRTLGSLYRRRGEYARALGSYEDAQALAEGLEDPGARARSLAALASMLWRVGEHDEALRRVRETTDVYRTLGWRAHVASSLHSEGLYLTELGEFGRAETRLRESRDEYERLGRQGKVCACVTNLGHLHLQAGANEKAGQCFERALALVEELGLDDSRSLALHNLGLAQTRLGHPEEGLALQQQALAEAERLGDSRLILFAEGGAAEALVALDRPREAMAASRRAATTLFRMAQALGEERGARTRSEFAELFSTGMRAAVLAGDPDALCYFLEAGRAGTLLETLSGGRDLQRAAVPEDLRREEAQARSQVAAARDLLTGATRSERIKEIRSRKDALAKAERRHYEAVQRIQREAKLVAGILRPEPATLDELKAGLASDEALVLYGLCDELAVALVVTSDDSRFVDLGDPAILLANSPDPTLDRAFLTAMDRLRARLVSTLALPPRVRRVLVSPHGALGYVPYGLLFEGREVAVLPSGTTWKLLGSAETEDGDGVLALGDPVYGTATEMPGAVVMRGGRSLPPLPASGEEARALGDVVLLGEDATEGGLATALESRKRWRALHLACHGLVEPDRPLLSSLALTPAGEDDGYLTALEILGTPCPADLVVLSACETARGRSFQAEGIMGLTRAFFLAGAPRVLCSLWRVDDEATRALMVKFYELWNPDEGEGLSAASALRQAQDHVRSHDKWKHPQYWAAWVLWGLP